MVFYTRNNCMFISVKVARHASSETRARLNAPNMGSAVAAVACAAWVAVVVALVDVSVLIIVANASSIVNPVLIKRKYQNVRAHIHRIRISMYNNACLDVRTVSKLSLQLCYSTFNRILFRAPISVSLISLTLLCTCIFTLNFLIVLYFYVTHDGECLQ